MKYLITGGAGFIGSHFTDTLLARGHHVTVLDDLSTGSLANLECARDDERFTMLRGCATNRGVVDELVTDADIVLHLAAAVGVRLVLERTAECIVRNVDTARTVLQAAGRARTPVVFASSSEVYGPSDRVPFVETDSLEIGSTDVGRWSYATSKAIGEFLAFSVAREQGIPVLCVRIFNTVGPRQSGRHGMVLPRFVGQALRGEPITVYGDGTQERCFSYVHDVVDVVLRLIDTHDAWGKVVNVGDDRPTAVLALAHEVRARCQSTSPIVHVEPEIGAPFVEPARRVPDLTRLRSLVGDVEFAPLGRIIDTVVEHCRQNVASR